MSGRPILFALPGDPASLTGGYGYDRRIAAGLGAAGWAVDWLRLDASFPAPDAAALARADAAFAALPDGMPVIADGLAFGAMPALAERHAARLRWIALVHHPLACETGLAPEVHAQLAASERAALATARAVIATGAATARLLAAEYGVAPARLHVVAPGCDRPALMPRPPAQAGAPLRLLCVATLTARKGHAQLIAALAGLTDRAWTLDCIGSGERDPAVAAAVRAAIAAHGLGDRIALHGEVDAATLARHYAGADAFVLASHFEGYGMAYAEALAHGLPVIGSAAGAIPDTVPAAAGLLLPPGDMAALRAALARLLDDADWRAGLAAGARTAAATLPDWPGAVARFAAVLQQTLGTEIAA
ncbi:glycosyltransferase family 4 protein [Derxia lacustris]|uniref:glycosyltransferase family 4 protein n=1 Tax=Derxia lacustris TaxID=764842 RepID=UPI000A16DA23|nr:glycosyltransferase family 4 protein [Derxia lacustris]